MPIETFEFPLVLEVLATIAWAGSGAIVARARGFDFMGVFFIATISATGGGLLRDGVLLQRIPVLLTNPIYLVVPFTVMIVVSLFGGWWERLAWWDRTVGIIDAFGTPAFAVLGFQLAILSGVPLIGALFVGLINGVAGGILRDILVGDIPQLFRPGQFFGTIALLAVLAYYILLTRVQLSSDAAAWAALVFAAGLRLVFIRRNWQSQAVNEWHMDRALARLPEDLAEFYRRLSAADGRDQPGDSPDQTYTKK